MNLRKFKNKYMDNMKNKEKIINVIIVKFTFIVCSPKVDL